MTSARRVRAVLKMHFELAREAGSHAQFRVGQHIATFAYHDSRDLPDWQLRKVARQFGMTLAELKELL